MVGKISLAVRAYSCKLEIFVVRYKDKLVTVDAFRKNSPCHYVFIQSFFIKLMIAEMPAFFILTMLNK
jgi:hypothetical protein